MDSGGRHRLDAEGFRQLVVSGAACLEANVEAINALNVFPVPDGDTGINMLLTLRASIDAPLPDFATATVGEMSEALARGALLGARGNSGVIFSQFMRGLASGLRGAEECDGELFGRALLSAANAGYQAVGSPVEGTMLSVMRAAAEGAQSRGGGLTETLRDACSAAEQALARTPEQLAVLKEAGVVDAGGQGVVAFLAGALGFAEGSVAQITIAAPGGGASADSASVSRAFLEHTEGELYGYCTQFVILGRGLDSDTVRESVMGMAASTVVVGDDAVVRVHAHADDPGPLLTLGASLGALDQISIQNMDLQHGEFLTLHGYGEAGGAASFAVVAVAPGEGIRRVFEDLGAASVVSGGQTMNPSAADILDGARRANAQRVAALPNNGNVVLAAEQARALEGNGRIDVVPSRTVPQGIAAMLAYNPERGAEENIAAMTAAMADVRSGEITTAARGASIDGVEVAEGEAIAILDGVLVGSGESPAAALLALIEAAEPEEGSLVTLYRGGEMSAAGAEEAAAEVASRFAEVEVETQDGGQPHYHFIVAIE